METVNQLFLLQDTQEWDLLRDILDEEVHLDMSTMGIKPANLTSVDLLDKWKLAFSRIDAVFHACSNHTVKMDGGSKASVKMCATTTHFKASAVHGMTRDFVGTYEVKLQKKRNGWRVSHFKFDLMYIMGNANLE